MQPCLRLFNACDCNHVSILARIHRSWPIKRRSTTWSVCMNVSDEPTNFMPVPGILVSADVASYHCPNIAYCLFFRFEVMKSRMCMCVMSLLYWVMRGGFRPCGSNFPILVFPGSHYVCFLLYLAILLVYRTCLVHLADINVLLIPPSAYSTTGFSTNLTIPILSCFETRFL
ncbi:hypothetical protein F5Y19DRAFT_183533 [Xylariaceae sp. FL1651]|nr:hypothetical protein F5Y19DRAFT_183533 [Xylariaceae sp. FL1651]